MLAGLSESDCSITGDADDADIVVVNTCAFVEDAKVESIDTILDMARRKEAGSLEKLVVTGCLAQRYPEELANDLPEVDHFVGTNDLNLVTEILDGRTGTRVAVGNPDRQDFNWEAPVTIPWAATQPILRLQRGVPIAAHSASFLRCEDRSGVGRLIQWLQRLRL